MGAPILVPCLVALRAEFNRVAPGRDKGADGWIGDAAHQQEVSDHNPDETGRTPYSDADSIDEVHAIDVDKDLGGGLDLDDYVETVRLRHQAGEDDRLQNIIWRGRISSRSWGWTWRPYTGASQHFDHAHFSARYTTVQESDTSPWGVFMSLTPADVDAVVDGIMARKLGSSGPNVAVALQSGYQNTVALIKAIGALDQVDEQALGASIAAALGPAVTADLLPQLVAAMPADGPLADEDLTRLAQLMQASVRAVLRAGTEG